MNLEPIHVPYRYNKDDSDEQKLIYALAQLGEATTNEIVEKLKQANTAEEITTVQAEEILKPLYDHGLINGEKKDEKLIYNLHKILTQNSGRTDLNGIKDVS